MGAPKWHLKCEMQVLCIFSHQEPISPSLDSGLALWLVWTIGCGRVTLYGFWALTFRRNLAASSVSILKYCHFVNKPRLTSLRVRECMGRALIQREGQASKLRPQSCE